jgi:hypothetical protein
LTKAFCNFPPYIEYSHLQNVRGYTIAETAEGIYTVKGGIIPMQIIDSRRLSVDENLWLKSLSDRLDYLEVTRISKEITRQKRIAQIAAYLYVIAKANPETIQEAIEMDNTLTIEKVFENVGWTAKWEARGEERKAFAIAQNLANLGVPLETVVSATQLEPEKIKPLYRG